MCTVGDSRKKKCRDVQVSGAGGAAEEFLNKFKADEKKREDEHKERLAKAKRKQVCVCVCVCVCSLAHVLPNQTNLRMSCTNTVK
jgi:hypothetical protein